MAHSTVCSHYGLLHCTFAVEAVGAYHCLNHALPRNGYKPRDALLPTARRVNRSRLELFDIPRTARHGGGTSGHRSATSSRHVLCFLSRYATGRNRIQRRALYGLLCSVHWLLAILLQDCEQGSSHGCWQLAAQGFV